jgi:hypothetical protein
VLKAGLLLSPEEDEYAQSYRVRERTRRLSDDDELETIATLSTPSSTPDIQQLVIGIQKVERERGRMKP